MDLQNALMPVEAAKFLDISEQKLGRLRRAGRLHGKRVGTTNLFMYTITDLRNADLTPRKRGPKLKRQNT